MWYRRYICKSPFLEDARMRKLGEHLRFVCSDIFPESHYLRKVTKLVDLSFVDKMCERK